MSTRTHIAILLLFCLGLAQSAAAKSTHDKPWYDWFWPLGERFHAEALKDEYVPFQGAGQIPERPNYT